jgi:hypothetical protein
VAGRALLPAGGVVPVFVLAVVVTVVLGAAACVLARFVEPQPLASAASKAGRHIATRGAFGTPGAY